VSRFKKGDTVHVRTDYPQGHARAPYFTRGHQGHIEQITGPYPNAEELAYGRRGAQEPLYRVRFRQQALWPSYQGSPHDTLVADLYEHWLNPGDRS
jgi:hypothetical protein|tara:strand:+ start:156 stop:443 length:288 start_codon:yes stop_codon:yes gene_type:complete